MPALDGRIALVTGAAGGIGAAICRRFAAEGAKVACLDLRPPAALVARILADGGTALALAADVSREHASRAAIAAVIEHWGALHLLVNGAAPDDPSGTVLELEPPLWDRILAVHLGGAYLMSRAALPHIIAAGGGAIIHIASQMGIVGAPGRPAYCAAKGALIQLARAMALDHAADNVRVNALSPGAIETRRLTTRFGSMEAAREAATPLHPIGRLGHPDEVAAAALFLASDQSSFMTGANLVIDGGYTAA